MKTLKRKLGIASAAIVASIALALGGALPAQAAFGTTTVYRTCDYGAYVSLTSYGNYGASVSVYNNVTGAYLGTRSVGGGGSTGWIKISTTKYQKIVFRSTSDNYGYSTKC